MSGMSAFVGLTGYEGCGKDTVASLLAREYGFERFALADRMRDALYHLDPLIYNDGLYALTLAELVDDAGWEGAKRHDEYGPMVRSLLQRFGTEVGRERFGEDFWVALLDQELEQVQTLRHELTGDYANIVVTDVRFPNEADWVRDMGGVVVRVTRPGHGPVNGHPSAAGLVEEDIELHNDGNLSDLSETVHYFCQNILEL